MEEKYDPKKVWDKIIKKQKKAFRSEGEYWRRMANALRKRNIRNREKVKFLKNKVAEQEIYIEQLEREVEKLNNYSIRLP
jgi:polyhydroxyalkanoate synthesis regulator phasin